MKAHDAIRLNIGGREMVALPYIEDLTDEQLMMRPHPDCNHIIWQIGHLIGADWGMVEGVVPGSMPPLPAGFAEKYTAETAKSDDPADFHTKEELLKLLAEQSAATMAALDKLSEADLDQPAPEAMQSYAPTVGAALSMLGTHWLMHAGQWVIVRRQLGKPPLY